MGIKASMIPDFSQIKYLICKELFIYLFILTKKSFKDHLLKLEMALLYVERTIAIYDLF
jgi:hypothetical protein